MGLTILGIIIIPISIWCFVFKSEYLLPLSIAFSVFTGAAVVNISGSYPIGLQPFYFINFLIFSSFIFKKLYHKNFLRLKDRNHNFFFLSLFLFSIYVSFSLVSPIIFNGLQVLTPRGGIDAIEHGKFESLAFSMSNVPPLVYIIFNSFYIHISLRYIEISKNLEKLKFLDKIMYGFYTSGIFVILVGLFQFTCSLTGQKFPDFIFYSSVSYTGGGEQTLLNLGRVASTFTEPSLAGSFLAAFSMYLICSFTSKKNALILLLLTLSILTLVLTTSSLGYISFFIALLAKTLFDFISVIRRGSLKKSTFSALYIFAFITVLLFVIFVSNSFLQEILSEVIFNKSSSGSYLNREASNEYSLILFFKTFGLGVGLGSHRPSSLLYFLISNIGFFGTLLFFCVFVIYPVYTKLRISRYISSTPALKKEFVFNRIHQHYEQFYWAYVTFMVSLFIANASINESFMWITLMIICVYSSTIHSYVINFRKNQCN